jgi:hypothetical protein
MKITRDKALAVTAYCRRNRIEYANASTYPGTRAAAERKQIRSTGGMLLHFPRDSSTNGVTWLNPRAYVLWKGEPLDAIEEACAFILMTQRQRTQIIVLRAIRATDAAEAAEDKKLLPAQIDEDGWLHITVPR